jgi:hypothetical protein
VTILQTALEHALTCTATDALAGFGTYLAQKLSARLAPGLAVALVTRSMEGRFVVVDNCRFPDQRAIASSVRSASR